jgi:hypothetical protein
MCIGLCVCCGSTFSFNPIKVPSLILGESREPVCEQCVVWANGIRKQRGLPEIKIDSQAYEAIEEDEL